MAFSSRNLLSLARTALRVARHLAPGPAKNPHPNQPAGGTGTRKPSGGRKPAAGAPRPSKAPRPSNAPAPGPSRSNPAPSSPSSSSSSRASSTWPASSQAPTTRPASSQARTTRPASSQAPTTRPASSQARTTRPASGRGYAGDYSGAVNPVYAPQPDGAPDPGEVVWAWVPYEDDPSQGKDRPVLLIGRNGSGLLGLMLTTRDRNNSRTSDPDYLDIGTGTWDSKGRPSEVKLDRILMLDAADIRRQGAVVDPSVFERVAKRLADRRG